MPCICNLFPTPVSISSRQGLSLTHPMPEQQICSKKCAEGIIVKLPKKGDLKGNTTVFLYLLFFIIKVKNEYIPINCLHLNISLYYVSSKKRLYKKAAS